MPIKTLHVCPENKAGESNTFIEMEISQLEELGIEVEPYFFNGRKNPLNYLKGAIALKTFLTNHHFDIIHIHFGQLSLLSIFLGRKCNVVCTVHGSELLGMVSKRGRYNLFLSQVLRFQTHVGLRLPAIKGVLFVSNKLLSIAGLGKSKLQQVIPCGVNSDIFMFRSKEKARKDLSLPQDKKVLFFPANPERKVKNFVFLERALESISRSEEYHLLIPKDYSLEKMARAYNASDVTIICSLHEGSPTVAKESLLSGTPILSLDIGDIHELSLTFNNIHIAKNEKDFVDLLNMVLDDKLCFQINNNFDHIKADNTAKRLQNFYKKVIDLK